MLIAFDLNQCNISWAKIDKTALEKSGPGGAAIAQFIGVGGLRF
jgi:hypothetical protein